jgi:hypothetical protein
MDKEMKGWTKNRHTFLAALFGGHKKKYVTRKAGA